MLKCSCFCVAVFVAVFFTLIKFALCSPCYFCPLSTAQGTGSVIYNSTRVKTNVFIETACIVQR